MRDFIPPPPPDSDDPFELRVWLHAAQEAHAAWFADMDRELARMRRIGSFISIAVPAALIALAMYYAAHRRWSKAFVEAGIAAGNITFTAWIERRTARRIAENQRRVEMIFADIERENDA